MNIFGVLVEPMPWHKVFLLIEHSMAQKSFLRIATLNPEFLLRAREDDQFRESLQKANIRTTDGAGLTLMASIFGVRLPRVTGASLVPALLALAEQENIPVIIYNQETGLSSQSLLQTVLQKKYPKLSVSHNQDPTVYSFVFCTYGAPAQEIFLAKKSLPSLYVGVGGSFDYLTGRQKRAPQFLQQLGIEWLWRLIHQPQRLRRMWRATMVFPSLFLWQKMVH
jgi:N-acetylglucosaminyldiphosphoundecaprenol N-acetyl-beta-D-mannosaminyltransferase